jgi:hypothetical protein
LDTRKDCAKTIDDNAARSSQTQQFMKALLLNYPEVGPDKLKELATARAALVK